MPSGLLDLPPDILLHIASQLCQRDKLALELVSAKLRALMLAPPAWDEVCPAQAPPLVPLQLTCAGTDPCGPQVEATLTKDSHAWLLRHARLIRALTLVSPLKLSPHCVPLYCQQARAPITRPWRVLGRANNLPCCPAGRGDSGLGGWRRVQGAAFVGPTVGPTTPTGVLAAAACARAQLPVLWLGPQGTCCSTHVWGVPYAAILPAA